ncbi:hypothetical protein [Rhizobium gei]|uniref:hypothetical protein n=1 Tax=Pararhizobium gei TaxID=1395951 RepID=UPI0023DCC0FF|nr:hypothetical protein [Rhizobium gei]
MLLGLIFMAATIISDASASEPMADAIQLDLQTAYTCKDIDGRKVWKGELAYYIQSYVYDGQHGDDATDMAADAVLPEDNTPETMREFEQACLTIAPSAANNN